MNLDRRWISNLQEEKPERQRRLGEEKSDDGLNRKTGNAAASWRGETG